jgi:hypothetical protein
MTMVWKLTCAAGILGASAILGAQAPGQQQPVDRPANPAATEASKVTISGCVKPGAAADSFILSNAAITPSVPGREAAPTIGTAGSTKSYNVVAKPGDDLSKHVNHKIEVTGTLSASRPPSASSTSTATASPAPDQPAETVTVQTVKMVAMTCP